LAGYACSQKPNSDQTCQSEIAAPGAIIGRMLSGRSRTHASLNVYEGPTATRDFLDPTNYQPTPLVELPDGLNPFREEGIRIFAKLMYLLPPLSIKSLPALHMLMQAEGSGELDGVDMIVENSSGNTAFSLAIAAKSFGVRQVIAMVPWDIAPGILDLLRLSGAEPRLMRDAPGEPSGIRKARDMGREKGVFNPGQYDNENNPAAYEKWMAPELWEQTKGKMSVFLAGMGTTGTLVGASRYFRRQESPSTIVGAICQAGHAVPGVRTEARLKEIAFDWRTAADCIVEVATKSSFKSSLELCRAGLIAGPSSGFALAGLLQFLRMKADVGGLDSLRNADGSVVAAFVCPDTPLPYLDKYSTHLDASDF
jgi:cysteine synthase